jgi:hypothetical protein
MVNYRGQKELFTDGSGPQGEGKGILKILNYF